MQEHHSQAASLPPSLTGLWGWQAMAAHCRGTSAGALHPARFPIVSLPAPDRQVSTWQLYGYQHPDWTSFFPLTIPVARCCPFVFQPCLVRQHCRRRSYQWFSGALYASSTLAPPSVDCRRSYFQPCALYASSTLAPPSVDCRRSYQWFSPSLSLSHAARPYGLVRASAQPVWPPAALRTVRRPGVA